MSDALTELRLFIENTGALSPKIQAITTELDRKVKQGKYDSALAPKAWLYLVDEGAVAYVTDPRPVHRATTAEKNEARRTFPTTVRKKLAEEMRDSYEEELSERGLSIHPERHLCGTCAKHETKAMKRIGGKLRAHHVGDEKNIGHRVEIHPGTDLWMRGDRYGTIEGVTPDGRYKVRMDKSNRVVKLAQDNIYRHMGPSEVMPGPGLASPATLARTMGRSFR